MISNQKYQRLKKKIKRLEQEQQRATGKRQQILQQLNEEFGLKGLASAKKKLKTLQRTQKENEAKFLRELNKFNKRVSKVLKQSEEEIDED